MSKKYSTAIEKLWDEWLVKSKEEDWGTMTPKQLGDFLLIEERKELFKAFKKLRNVKKLSQHSLRDVACVCIYVAEIEHWVKAKPSKREEDGK